MKPNFLIIIVDEERYPVAYETTELKEWKKKNLRFQTKLAKKGTVFHNHYTNTIACTPARATLHTGQYPLVHGVTQTDGLAKPADDPEMKWLDKFTVPTMGNYFTEHGYKTILKGKWHISESSIKYPSGQIMNTYDSNGKPIPELEEIYLKQNVLRDYGYNGWIGPEPHGMAPLNSGSSVPKPERGRDVGYTHQIINELDNLDINSKDPWLLFASLVQPHDITLFGNFTDNNMSGFDFDIDPTLPQNLFTDEYKISHHESLDTKPQAQKDYRDLYPKAIQPILNTDKYQRYYYSAQKYADENIQKIWKKLKSTSMYKNTIILFMSDHGDLLASHGSMYQKWHNAYQEAIHIPLIISSPLFGNKHRDIYELTSHIDILPTLLGLADANIECLRNDLMKKFKLAVPLPGRNLSKYFEKKYYTEKFPDTPFYFYTEDEPFKGENQVNALCEPYDSIPQPNHVQAIIAKWPRAGALPHGSTKCKNELWKLTNYYGCNCQNKCPYGGIRGELYNLTNDPTEVTNLINNDEYADIQNYLNDLMNKYSFIYRGQ